MERKKTMRKKILSVTGLSLAFSFLFSKTALAMWSTSNLSVTGLPDASIYDIIGGILDWLLTIVGIVGVIAFAIAGIMYLTAFGDDKRITTAKSAMTYSIIGVIVALVGLVVLRAVDSMLNSGYLF
jgi:hypothetical protein